MKFLGTRTSRRLNYGNPVNRTAPLNRGRTTWWLNLPKRRGADSWLDLISNRRGDLVNGPIWAGSSRPSGFGSLETDLSGTQYVDISATSSLAVSTTEITVAVWAKNYSTAGQGIFQQFNPATSYSGWGLLFDPNGDNNVIGWWIGDTFGGGWVYGTSNSEDSKWHRILGRAKSNGDCSLWVDGVNESGEQARTTALAVTTNAAIGRRPEGSNYLWGGVDDCTTWSRALSDNEIQQDWFTSRMGYQEELNWLPTVPWMPVISAATTFIPLVSDGEFISPSALIGRGLIHS